jgi:hypothetical protein
MKIVIIGGTGRPIVAQPREKGVIIKNYFCLLVGSPRS